MTGLGLNLGGYYGDGTASPIVGYRDSGTSRYSARTRAASSVNFNTMSRNIAAGYSADIELIQKYLEDGKTDKAIEKYESLFEDVKTTTGNYNYVLTDSEIQSILKNAYEGTTGTSVVESIEANTSGSFWTGFKQSIPIIGWFCNETSEAEALAKLAGDEVTTKDKALEIAGGVVGTIIFGGLGVFGIFGKANKANKAIKIASGVLAGATAATAASEIII